jgi:putative PIN family toxin of toxin-antitoxin system
MGGEISRSLQRCGAFVQPNDSESTTPDGNAFAEGLVGSVSEIRRSGRERLLGSPTWPGVFCSYKPVENLVESDCQLWGAGPGDIGIVADTDVIVAAMRSPGGASAAILLAVRRARVELLLSVPLAMEYEAVCLRPEHQIAAELSEQEVLIFVDAVIAMAEPVKIHFLWRPQLRDPSDEMVLETAVNGRADLLVTFDERDYGTVPERFGIQVTTPRRALERIEK